MSSDWDINAATKKKPANLNQMTERLLRKSGWELELTQSYNAKLRLSKDLWGFADLIAFMPNESPVILIQACSTSSRANRMRKILNNKVANLWVLQPNRGIWLIHWSKHTQRQGSNWYPRIEIILPDNFTHFLSTGELPPCQRG